MSRPIYLTFPVPILRGAFTDLKTVCNDAICYAIYKRYEQCEDETETLESLGISSTAFYDSVNRGKKLAQKFNCEPMVSIRSSLVFQIRDNRQSDFQITVFLAFCGLRSILGNKDYTKTNNVHLIARMAGFKDSLTFAESGVRIGYFDTHFSTAQKIRYQLTEKIIERELVLNWGLKYYSSNERGFWFSFKLPFETLVSYAELNRKSNRVKRQKSKEAEAIRQVKKHIENYIKNG